jgi:hypothetical protein
MTKPKSEQHHEEQRNKVLDPCRGDDGAKAITIDQTAKDPGNQRGGGSHPHHPDSGKSS